LGGPPRANDHSLLCPKNAPKCLLERPVFFTGWPTGLHSSCEKTCAFSASGGPQGRPTGGVVCAARTAGEGWRPTCLCTLGDRPRQGRAGRGLRGRPAQAPGAPQGDDERAATREGTEANERPSGTLRQLQRGYRGHRPGWEHDPSTDVTRAASPCEASLSWERCAAWMC
jgi:hypothetical protein